MITLSELAIYPIKSTSQIRLQKARISPFGLEMDRRWMLIDAQGYMLTQRKHPRMCLIQGALESINLDNANLSIFAPDMTPLTVPVKAPESLLKATVWGDTCNAHDCGPKAAEWFSRFLQTPTRLVYFPDNEKRQVDLGYAQQGDITAFSDGFPYLLISQGSLDDLNGRLKTPVEMQRFRPNLVVTGTEAFAEDNWKKIRIGDITFRLVKPCSRCSIPSINPQTAEKTAEVVTTLAGYRMRENKIFFGQNVIAEGSGQLSVGMAVEVLD